MTMNLKAEKRILWVPVQKLKNCYKEIIKLRLALYFFPVAFYSGNNEAKISKP